MFSLVFRSRVCMDVGITDIVVMKTAAWSIEEAINKYQEYNANLKS